MAVNSTSNSKWYHRFFVTTENEPFLACLRYGYEIQFFIRDKDDTPPYAVYNLNTRLLDLSGDPPLNLVMAARSFIDEIFS